MITLICILKIRCVKEARDAEVHATNKNGIAEVSTLARRNSNLESVQSAYDKTVETRYEEVKTLNSITPTVLDYEELYFNYCTNTEVIKLLQSTLNSCDVTKKT